MIPSARITEMWQQIRIYGSGNCWTGTTGKLSKMIFELLTEREERSGTLLRDEPIAPQAELF